MTANEKLTAINEALESGKIVTFTTYTHQTVINQKTLTRFQNAGQSLFKVSGNSLYMARGKHWDCIDYSAMRIWAEV